MFHSPRKGRRAGGLTGARGSIPVTVHLTTRAVTRFAAAAVILAAAAGCASAPKRTAAELWPILPSDQALYLSVQLDRNRPFFHELLSAVDQNSFTMRFTVDRTEAVAASLDFPEPGRADFAMTAAGSYPGALVGWQMFWDKAWHSKKGTLEGERYSWWENEEAGLQMAVLGGQLALVSNGKIERLLRSERSRTGAVIPESVRTAAEHADLLVYTPSPAKVFTGGAIEQRLFLAMNEFWVSLEAVEEGDAAVASVTKTSVAGGTRDIASITQVDDGAAAGDGTDRDNDPVREYAVSGAFTLRDERAARVYGALVKVAFAAWLNRMEIGNLRTVQEQLQVRTEGARLSFFGLRIPEAALVRLVTELYRSAGAETDVTAAEPGR